MTNDELTARLQAAMDDYDSDTLGDDPHEFDSWRLLYDVKAALEAECANPCTCGDVQGRAQSAQLVADSREALAGAVQDAILEWAGEEDAPTFGFIVDHLLASGVVSLAADRDRAIAKRAWRECVAALNWCLMNGPAEEAPRYLLENNPYRESEGK